MENVRFTDIASIPAVIAEMTLEEKASLLTGESSFSTRPIERLGIPKVAVLDGAPGINYGQLFGDYAQQEGIARKKANNQRTMSGMEGLIGTSKITKMYEEKGEIDESQLTERECELWHCIKQRLDDRFPNGVAPTPFPAGMLLGATWNPDVVYNAGEAVGREFDAYRIDVMLGPNVNIHRDPLNGRLFEGYSEDPMLITKLAPEFIKGAQSTGIAAEPKHYAVNNQETARMGVEEHVPMQALREIYFPGFRACVQEGGTKTIMSAYNKINGTACALNRWLLTDVLRDEWGFDGVVVSDWGAVYDQVEAIKAGNDLEMPANPSWQAIIDAVNSGELDIKLVDLAVERQLKLMLKLPVMAGRRFTGIDDEYSRKAAYEAACEGIVLLKNNSLLPLNKQNKVCFMGEKSLRFLDCGAGSAYVTSTKTSSLFGTAVGCLGENAVYGKLEKDAQAVVIAVHAKGQEGRDRPDMDLEPEDKAMLLSTIKEAKALGLKIVVVLNVSGPVDMREYIDDVDAILCVFLPGCEGAHAAGDIIFGNVNPSGKLPITFPVKYQDCPTYGNFPGYGEEVWYGEGIYVGYRYYDYKDVKPQFAFGHGLSYTKFKVLDFSVVSGLDAKDGVPAKFTARVKNVGGIAGKEVLQLYVSKRDSELPRAVKELKAFKKVYLEAGEEKEITFTLTMKDLEAFDIKLNSYIVERGKYFALLGTASDEILFEEPFDVKCKNPYYHNSERGFGKVFSDGRCVDIYNRRFGDKVPFAGFSSILIYSPDIKLGKVLSRSLRPELFGGEEARDIALNDFYAEIAELD